MDLYVTPTAVAGELDIDYGADLAEDAAIDLAVSTASRGIDRWCRRQFSNLAAQTRRFGADGSDRLWLDRIDVQTVTTLAVDVTGRGSFSVVAAADYVLGPHGADQDLEPYRWIRRLTGRWPAGIDTVQITGDFGWPAVPDEISFAAKLLAVQLWKRAREASFGVMQAPTIDGGLIRVIANDGQVKQLLHDYRRRTL